MGFAVEKKEANLILAVPTVSLRWDINRSHDRRHAFRAASPVTLLMTAVDQWRKWRLAPDVQRANAFRRVKLVAGQ